MRPKIHPHCALDGDGRGAVSRVQDRRKTVLAQAAAATGGVFSAHSWMLHDITWHVTARRASDEHHTHCLRSSQVERVCEFSAPAFWRNLRAREFLQQGRSGGFPAAHSVLVDASSQSARLHVVSSVAVAQCWGGASSVPRGSELQAAMAQCRRAGIWRRVLRVVRT